MNQHELRPAFSPQCNICDAFIDQSRPGNPTLCLKCEREIASPEELVVVPKPILPKQKCPECSKWVKRIGLDQHLKDAHHTSSAEVTAKKMVKEMERIVELYRSTGEHSGKVECLSLIEYIQAWVQVHIK